MKTYLCQELGGDSFTIKAIDQAQAEYYASIYGAVVVKELK